VNYLPDCGSSATQPRQLCVLWPQHSWALGRVQNRPATEASQPCNVCTECTCPAPQSSQPKQSAQTLQDAGGRCRGQQELPPKPNPAAPHPRPRNKQPGALLQTPQKSITHMPNVSWQHVTWAVLAPPAPRCCCTSATCLPGGRGCSPPHPWHLPLLSCTRQRHVRHVLHRCPASK
jgi:hypothetical protein